LRERETCQREVRAARGGRAAALSGSETPVGIRYGYSAGLSFDDGLAKPGGS